MKRLIASIISMMLVSTVLFAGEKVPEFDGCYLKLSNGKLIELKKQHYRQTYIAGTSWNNFSDPSRKVYFVTDKNNMISTYKKIVGIVYKGTNIEYVAKYLSVHPLVRKSQYDVILPKNMPFVYAPGRHLPFHSKSLAKDTYYFRLDNKLTKGEYVVWIGEIFYLFKLR